MIWPKRKSPSVEELIVKHSSKNKIFLDEIGVQPEVAFREDREGDKRLIKGQIEEALFKVKVRDGFSVNNNKFAIIEKGRKNKKQKN